MTTRRLIGILAAAIAGAASAQTAVTTAGGSSGTVPVFNGTSSVTNSVITQSGGNVGIGTTNPATQLGISGNLTAIITQTQTAPMQSGSTYTVGGITYVDNYLRDSVPSNPAAYIWIRSVDAYSAFPETIRGTQIEFGTADGLDGQGTKASTAMTINPSGLVGIGTSTPGSPLEIKGNVTLTKGSGASITYQDGSVQSVAWNGILQGGDYAESVDVSGDRAEYEPGDVLVIDPASKGKFLKSSEPYSTAVMGVYSTRPGVVGRRQKTDRSHMKDEVPLAMVGVVPTKVTSEGGAIKAGDLLVTSSRPGYAMKGKDRSLLTGAIIGKALEPLDAGTGVIEVAVSIQ